MPLQASTDFARLGSWVATALALVVLFLVLAGTFLERSRTVSATATTMLLLGLVVLPVFMVLFGAFASVEQAKSVEFCHSCHTAMNPYVADMRDPQSTSLAAIHFSERYIPRNPCYRCHANYGVWGEADAKLRGFAHLYHRLGDTNNSKPTDPTAIAPAWSATPAARAFSPRATASIP